MLIANVLISNFQAFDFEFRFFHNHVTEKWRLYTFQPLLTTFLISLQILTQPVNSGLSFNIARKSDFVEYFRPFASFEKLPNTSIDKLPRISNHMIKLSTEVSNIAKGN